MARCARGSSGPYSATDCRKRREGHSGQTGRICKEAAVIAAEALCSVFSTYGNSPCFGLGSPYGNRCFQSAFYDIPSQALGLIEAAIGRLDHQGQRRAVVKLFPHADTQGCLLYTSDAADERSSVDLGGRR